MTTTEDDCFFLVIYYKNSFRHHFVDLEDINILNLKQFAVIKDE
jgi:hypothetical protein